MSDSVAAVKKLVLVDAYSLLFRAFFAGRYLSTRDNRPTGALFGFTSMLFSILNNEQPDAIVVCWDAPERTLRSQEFEAYKAHRPETDPQLIAQMPVARQMVTAFGIQSAELAGYEADDLIGTLAAQGVKEGYEVVILTGDSDQLQLVDDHVVVQMTQKGVSEVKVYDAAAVRERYGIGPERIADYKALVGDTSDNIPGVPGIGDKTASALLQQFGSLNEILERIPEVTPPKARATLEANIDQARFSLRLATIVCDAPLEFTIKPYAPSAEDWQRVRELFADLEFRALASRIPQLESPPVTTERAAPTGVFQARITTIESDDDLEEALNAVRSSGKVAIRLEMDGENALKATLRGIAFAPSSELAYTVPIKVRKTEIAPTTLFDSEAEEETGYAAPLAALRELFETPDLYRIAYNAKPILIAAARVGLDARPFEFDALIAAYLLDAGRSSYPLMDLVATYLGVQLEADDTLQPGMMRALEAAAIFALTEPMRARLADFEMISILEQVEMPLIPALAAIELEGLLVDADYLNELGTRMGVRIDSLAEEIYALADTRFNIGSTKQLQEVLFTKLQLPTGKKTKTGFSTGADLLEQLAPQVEIARKIIDYREVAKLKATYTDALVRLMDPKTHRVHTSLNQTVASTGRLSSSDPNLQNIPVRSEIGREIRRAFIAPPHKVLLSVDYSQVELRLLAHITHDETLMQAFTADEDIHSATAAIVFGVPLEEVTKDQRRQAKTINFAVIYGQSGFALANTLGVGTSEANTWIKEYFERLPGVKRYVEETMALARQQRYVQTLLGRRRAIPEIESSNIQVRQAAERAAVNMPIQGTAADIMKLAMIQIYHYLQETPNSGCTLLLQVHDELLFEVDHERLPVVTTEIVQRMESAFPLDVPLKTEARAGVNWAEMDKSRV